jgi:hypothetical protein
MAGLELIEKQRQIFSAMSILEGRCTRPHAHKQLSHMVALSCQANITASHGAAHHHMQPQARET